MLEYLTLGEKAIVVNALEDRMYLYKFNSREEKIYQSICEKLLKDLREKNYPHYKKLELKLVLAQSKMQPNPELKK